jgi:hypothetical protein
MNSKYILTAILLIMFLFPINASSQNNLLIIAPDEFVDELQALKRFKDATGIPTMIVSLTDIYNNSVCSTGSRDNPETIKKCIDEYVRSDNIQYVLLAGDSDKFPIRSIKGYNTIWGSMYFPSDLYYADLYNSNGNFDDWDGGNFPYGGNFVYGETDFTGFSPCDMNKLNLDRIDLYPDVAVGRVPASNETEITTYIKKVITYELNAHHSWFRQAAWVVDNDYYQEDVKERLEGYLSGFSIHPLYYKDWDFITYSERAAKINDSINNRIGFVNHAGHAGVDNWNLWYHTSFMSGLTNNDAFPIIYSLGCGTARFFWQGCGCGGCTEQDLYQDILGNVWTWQNCTTATSLRPEPASVQPAVYDRDSLAEEFLVKRSTGGVAYLGYTFVSEYGGQDLDKYFFEAYDVGAKPPTLGYMWNYALSQFIANAQLCSYYAYIALHKVMLFGDPSLRVGGAFDTGLCGVMYDGGGGPLNDSARYLVTCDITVPSAWRLTVNAGAPVLFEGGKKITALDTNSANGLIVNGTDAQPVFFISSSVTSDSANVFNGIKISGQMRIRNGGQLKIY